MKNFAFIVVFFFCVNSYSQKYNVLDIALRKKYPVKEESFVPDGVWMYYPDMGNLKKKSLNSINKIHTYYEYYTVNLTYFLDRHIDDVVCIVLLNKKDNSISLITPFGYGYSIVEYFSSISGHQFKNKIAIKNFIKDFEKIITLIDSGMHLGKTSYEKNKIIINLILNDHDDIWNKLELNFNNNKFIGVVWSES